jgi:16S rRNA (guanine527-N7)-methyltransferase
MEISVNRFLELLWEENKKQNLISRQAGKVELEQHVADSMHGLKWTKSSGLQIIDIGSGAGFPAIIMALVSPQNRFTLVESDIKKSRFLSNMVEQLEMKNCQVICERVEKVGHQDHMRGQFDLCTNRAVASMRVLIEYGLPLLRLGGRLIMWKGSNYQQEIREAETAMKLVGGRIQEIFSYNLMGINDRTIVIVEKNQITPEKSPRRIGVPTKRPL